ncbi:hypothetical protein ACXHMN_04615 [Rhizobium sp. LEGMi12c]
MDFLSIILSAIGWENDRASKASDRKIEAYKLVSEVAAECMRTTHLLTSVRPGIEQRLAMVLPDQPEIAKSCSDAFTKMLTDTAQVQAMAESYKPMIQTANSWADWENILMRLHEWRSTAAGIYPYAEATVRRFEELLSQAEQEALPAAEPHANDKVVAFRDRDRGFDAPPL